MGFKLLDFYKISPPVSGGETDPERSVRFKRIRWATFLSATTGYGIYYVCRLSMNVIRKPIVEDGVFTETQLGIIGSCLFFVYAVGKLTNGFLADRSNVKRFMSTGLLCSALINLCLGFTNSFLNVRITFFLMKPNTAKVNRLYSNANIVANNSASVSEKAK